MEEVIGKKFGQCRIIKQLGAGGMGAVYLARHETLDKEVAIKVIAPEYASNPVIVQRMLREAKLAAKLEHPNVVQVYDAAIEDGIPYIVMQFVDGRTLQDMLSQNKRLVVKDALEVTRRVAMALSAAHKLGIVHRDIKPGNVLLSKDGKVKVADFGLARTQAKSEDALTTKDIVIGTPQFMSPEQARGEEVDGRADLYSLGNTLYAMLTGAPPFNEGTAMGIAIKQADVNVAVADPRTRIKDLPEPVAQLVLKMLAKRKEDRFQSADELIRAIDAQIKPTMAVPAPAKLSRWWLIAVPIAALLAVFFVISPSAAERMVRDAEATKDPDMAIFKYRQVIEKYPKSEWAKKSELAIQRLTDQKEVSELKAAADFAKANPGKFPEARRNYESFLEKHPSSSHAAEARSELTKLHVAEIKARYVEVEKIFKSDEIEKLIIFVDPKAMEEKGQANMRRLLVAGFKVLKEAGWEFDKLTVHEVRVDPSFAKAEADYELFMHNTKKGEKQTKSETHVLVLRNNTWYLEQIKKKK